MKVAHLTPGTGNFHCGSCLRDHTLVTGLRGRGHDAFIVPLYLPLVLDQSADDAAKSDPTTRAELQLGGIKTWLLHRSRLFRKLPRALTRWLDVGPLLRGAAHFADMTSPEELGEMTHAMLQGADGSQRNELERLAEMLEREQPELVVLSNVLLAGAAPFLIERLGVPVASTLQGEDSFLDALPEPWRERCWSLLRERAASLAGVLPVSETYGALMAERLALPSERIHAVHNGISHDDYAALPALHERPTEGPIVLGYLARLCPEKGLDALAETFMTLRERGHDRLRLLAVGAATGKDRRFVENLHGRLDARGHGEHARFWMNVTREQKLAALGEMSLFSVPALYGESFGLYLLEAQAAGLPVIQPKHAAFPELLEHLGGGILYDPAHPEAAADAIETLIKDPERARELGARGRAAVAERFTTTAFTARAEAAYQTILDRSREPADSIPRSEARTGHGA